MRTQCPECNATFHLSPGQIRAAQGYVRCGECGAVFDGLAHLTGRQPPPEPEPTAPLRTGPTFQPIPDDPFDEEGIEALLKASDADELALDEEEPILSWHDITAQKAASPDATGAEHGHVPPPDIPDTTTLDIPADFTLATTTPEAETEELPAVLADEAPVAEKSSWGWTLGSLVLLAGLGIQFLYFNHVMLARHEPLRPALGWLCQYAGCELPPRRNLQAIELLERDIRSHPRYQGALRITATLINRAPFAQPYPQLELTLHDLAGRPVASRRFLPGEYLGSTAPAGLLPPSGTARVALEVVDPGGEALGFQFSLH